MGLDIYFHHTKRSFNGSEMSNDDLREFTEQIDKDAQDKLRKAIAKPLAELEKIWSECYYTDDKTGEEKVNQWRMTDYNRKYFDFVVEVLKPIIAANFDFRINTYTKGVLPFPELKAALDKEIEIHYEQYDAYFRKVNFLFAYFENKGLMIDSWFAFVDKEHVDDIIYCCEKVLKDHGDASGLLPTQSGFFFGSTDYDEWYFHDVKDCLKQMKQYRKLLKDGVTGYVIFSW